ncbi:hypothetical protein KAU08_07965 [bacterium]|nr:hypothetical protein [bacterium]
MKKLLFVVFVLAIFTIGCGGGGSSDERNLAGLEGNWGASVSQEMGVVWLDGSSDTYQMDFVAGFTIYLNSIIDEEGTKLNWSYNGSTLHINTSNPTQVTLSNYPGCVYTGTEKMHYIVIITPGATSANFTGTGTLPLASSSCQNGTGTLNAVGTMVKL